jgi:hypothetical protein
MSLSKSKCLYSNNCLRFFKRAVPLQFINFEQPREATVKDFFLVTVAYFFLFFFVFVSSA